MGVRARCRLMLGARACGAGLVTPLRQGPEDRGVQFRLGAPFRQPFWEHTCGSLEAGACWRLGGGSASVAQPVVAPRPPSFPPPPNMIWPKESFESEWLSWD